MKFTWLQQSNAPSLILFFNGWGMDAAPFRHLPASQHAVLTLYDYRDLSLPEQLRETLATYQKIQVVAWSLGVWVAQTLLPQLPAASSLTLAINGSGEPIHDRYGISPTIFTATREQFNADTRGQFYRNMFASEEEFVRFQNIQPQRDLMEQHKELAELERLITQSSPTTGAEFSVALIGGQDRIIPAKNQIRYWKNRCPCRVLDTGHFPFFRWQRWEEMLADAADR